MRFNWARYIGGFFLQPQQHDTMQMGLKEMRRFGQKQQ